MVAPVQLWHDGFCTGPMEEEGVLSVYFGTILITFFFVDLVLVVCTRVGLHSSLYNMILEV